MSRISKIGTVTVDLERITAIDVPPQYTYNPAKVYLYGGGEISIGRTSATELLEIWEEYMNNKTPKLTIEELEEKLREKDHYIAMLKADTDSVLRSIRR